MNKQLEELASKLASHLNITDAVENICEYIHNFFSENNLIVRGNLLADLSESSSEDEKPVKPKLVKEELETMTIANLKDICKKMNLRISGNKSSLVQRLLDAEMTANIIPHQTNVKTKKPKRPVVFEKVNSKMNLIPLKKYDNLLYDQETKLVFDKNDPTVAIGTCDDNQIFPLTTNSMELCKSKGLTYIWPSNIVDES